MGGSNKQSNNVNKIVSGVAAAASLIGAAKVAPWLAVAEPVADTIYDHVKQTMEDRKRLVSVPELYSEEYRFSVEQAVELLDGCGLKSTLVKTSIHDADEKYRNCFASQVISTKPKGKQKVEPGSMVFVKYITQEIIDESKRKFDEREEIKNEAEWEKKNKNLKKEQRRKEFMQNTQIKMQKIFQKKEENDS